jgi:hypothetical protein
VHKKRYKVCVNGRKKFEGHTYHLAIKQIDSTFVALYPCRCNRTDCTAHSYKESFFQFCFNVVYDTLCKLLAVFINNGLMDESA